ncbi:protein of unknown function [Peptoclostridium litorale DSM 5388]|uniref:Prolow-density lipoprotein receptor-related protein 1-like beta-propeller domain-containing protein n=1 Tax=Peptoclostridium litorale DSM 5388 TaxID=1121324 RepID=A0A069RDF7_PEPLI|nr:DUF5050 domain-containing protein [Peptoclostridium litorale]KDR95071.1 hypothetical protein CLIT_11c01000 [Peptoclostridium litorale DSM 5388]SIN75494.1 protein of unknown function [Peptoclostridium litorale DSM 5388]
MKKDLLALTVFIFAVDMLIGGIEKLNSNGVYKKSGIYLYLVGVIPVISQMIEWRESGFGATYAVFTVIIGMMGAWGFYSTWRRKEITAYGTSREMIEMAVSDILLKYNIAFESKMEGDIVNFDIAGSKAWIKINKSSFGKDIFTLDIMDYRKIPSYDEMEADFEHTMANEAKCRYMLRGVWNLAGALVAMVFLQTIVSDVNIIKEIGDRYESYRLSSIENIVIKDECEIGNTQSNANNYGVVAETDDYIFYANETYVYRTDKDFSRSRTLINESSGPWKDSLNIVEDWVFFQQEKEITRMKIDGSDKDRLFKGYAVDMHVIGNWIYFINYSDGGKVYRMDVNGQNKEVICDKEVSDMTVYEGCVYYSYKGEEEEQGHLEVMNIDGSEKRYIAHVNTRDMVVEDGYIYYIDYEKSNLYRMEIESGTMEKLSGEDIVGFSKDGEWIFYTLKAPEDSTWDSKGLYKMDIDGSNVMALDFESYLDFSEIGVTKDWVFYNASNDREAPRLRRIRKDGSGGVDLGMVD